MAGTPGSGLMWRALGASVLVHVAVALCIPALAWTASPEPSVETISFVRITHLVIAPHPRPRPQPRAQAPHRAPTPKVTFATRNELAHTSHRRIASPPPAISHLDSSAPTVADVSAAGASTGEPSSAPVPTPTPPPAVATTDRHRQGGLMPFTAEQPDPVLDPEVRKQLQSLGVHVTLIVTVDEDGRTENVAFVPPIDASTQARIASLLADASWDPAVCGGGISCEGRATIKL
ncbi:MAG TPA: hypothetical protein VMF61_13915 [Candidatus Acidoferrales bacterium]|nr:hypothetical protein [Candidatus Acidoferrales bacterium]